MNKRVFGRKLSRSRPAREALFAALVRSMVINGKIETTKAKAKAVQGTLEKFVTLAKRGGVNERRRVLGRLDNSREATDILFQKVAKAFLNRNSGFTRIISLPNRKGDNAQMVRLEWTEKIAEEKRNEHKQSLPSNGKSDKSKKEKVAKKKDSSLKSSYPKS